MIPTIPLNIPFSEFIATPLVAHYIINLLILIFIHPHLEGHINFERLDQGTAGIVDADNGKDKSEGNYKVVVVDLLLLQNFSFQLQVEVARPDETQHGASEATDESHQDLKVWNEAGHQNCPHDDADPESESPYLQLTVECPDRGHLGLWRSPEEVAL